MDGINNAVPLEPQIGEQESDTTAEENQLTVRSKSEPENSFNPQPKDNDIKLGKCEKIVLFCCLIVAFVSTVCTMSIASYSSLRKNSQIAASRPSYWWYFLFCLILSLSIAQGMATILQKPNNIPFFNCFFILTLFNIIIEIIVILRIIFVLIPENIEKETVSEVFIFLTLDLIRFFALISVFIVVLLHVGRVHKQWDVGSKDQYNIYEDKTF